MENSKLDILDPPGMELWQMAEVKAVKYRDNLTVQQLKEELVEAARRKESFSSKGVWELRPWAAARQRQGKPIISLRWLDVSKGDDMEPNYRSRLVARESSRPVEEPIFAFTPPLERRSPKRTVQQTGHQRAELMVCLQKALCKSWKTASWTY